MSQRSEWRVRNAVLDYAVAHACAHGRVVSADLAELTGCTPRQAGFHLRQYARRGWFARVEDGVYAPTQKALDWPGLQSSQVLALIKRHGQVGGAFVAAELGVSRDLARKLLSRMHRRGLVGRVIRGVYGMPDGQEAAHAA